MPTDRAILLTPPGAAAIAVIRISGPGIRRFLESHFSRPLTPNRAVHGHLRGGQQVLDDPVVVLSADGRTADINLHGGAWVIASVFQLLAREGFERTDATMDAFDAGTMIEREMLGSLPLAKTETGIRMLLAQPQAWTNLLEGTKTNPDIRRIIIEGILSDQCLHHMIHPPRVAIVGAPNVGKSTLANQLFAQERVITADAAGTTRDWVGEIANIDGLPVMLIDTPGLRETDDAIEAQAIKQSRMAVDFAQLIIHVIAPVFDPEPRLIRAPAGAFQAERRHVITVLNKLDVLRTKDTWPGLYGVHMISALTGEGMQELRDKIRRYVGCADLAPERRRCWTPRQREILKRALTDPTALAEILSPLPPGKG